MSQIYGFSYEIKYPDNLPKYGTPNCTFISQISVVNYTEAILLTSEHTFSYEVILIPPNSFTSILNFSVTPDSDDPIVLLNKRIPIKFDFDCSEAPLLSLKSSEDTVFVDRKISLDVVLLVKLNYTRYYSLGCQLARNYSNCFGCQIQGIPSFADGLFNITLNPIMNIHCNYSTSPLNITIIDVYQNSAYTLQVNNPLSTLNNTNFISVSTYPESIQIVATYNSNSIGPKISSIIEIRSKENQLFNLIAMNSFSNNNILPTFIGYSSNTSSSHYLCQTPIQTSLSFNQSLYNFKDNIVLLNNRMISKEIQFNDIFENVIDGNIYIRSDFRLGQSDSFKIEYNYQTVQFKFPFGFGKGTLKQYNHIFDYPFSVYTQSMNVLPIYQIQPFIPQTYNNPIPEVDKTAPFLISCNITALSYYSFRYTIQAGDIESGIYSITILEDYDPRGEGTVILYQSNIIGGNIWNGTFSVDMNVDGYNHDSSFSIVIESRSGLKSIFKSETFIPFTVNYINRFPKKVYWSVDDILDIQAVFNDTNPIGKYTSKLFLLLAGQDDDIIPRIQIDILPPNLSKSNMILSGSFVPGTGFHEFSLPYIPYSSSFGDNLNYVLLGDRDIPSKVESYSDIVMMPPTLKAIDITTLEQGLQFNFTFQCFGQVNCENTPITNGYVVIQGEYDPVPKRFNFSQISNNFASLVELSKTTCRSQNYTVVSAYLSDGYRESDSDDPNTISPFLYIQRDNLSVYHLCYTPAPDSNPPTLTSFSMSPTSINASIAYFIVVQVVIEDDQRIKYFPTFYWGAGNISVSLYGLTDEYDNFNGYSTYDLSKFNQSIIHRKYDGEPPTPAPYTPQPTTKPPTTPPPPCTNQCSNNGVCILNNQCKCNSGYFGPNCEGTSFAIPKPLPDPEEPRVISDPKSDINLEISIEELVEIDSLEVVSNRYSLLNKKWTLMTSNNNNTYKYSLAINNETNLYIQIDWSDQERIIQFAGLNITIAPHSLKYTISLDHYSFKSNLNFLQLRMSTNFSSNDEKCSSSIETSGNNNDLEWIKLQYNGKILYGRFVQIALVDDQPQKASTKLIESEEEGGSSYFGINIPFFVNTVVLDPDFSVLVTDQYDKCKDPLLSTGAIIGIAVGGAVFVILSLTSFIIFYNRTRRAILVYKLKSLLKPKSNTVELN
ncbi:hypothetical protein PPL_06871 [Heterostelium album PN500]|uniref:EGF-like domain-containing protein n=1 Tax=Heterostelium pallidum (strain ATCC 26659 / Pp 5 / PN500) TaxID=670386 RepID=D3BDR9_HETP5|nr:hypothetical protein PPL_06871 [Heterostelium album PN500]EFA80050.1 hypothetical protein PPL_06871 [Heterostelium album PN500]|eukprot:XP_020432170.1 hypothetical protein PPL_06871 [Heterostelium album PN500]